MEPYIGEIRLVGFNFAPVGWELCNGQLLPISEYSALFNLLGTTYGGDGINTFGLPNLQSRAAIHQGNGYVIGQLLGTESAQLTTAEIPSHNHPLQVSGQLGTAKSPVGNLLAQAPLGLGNTYVPYGDPVQLNVASIASTGGNQPHNNMMPFLTMNYIISLFGIFPSQG